MPSDLPWEDSLLERKPESDTKDLLKTLVAFANSVRPGHVAEIRIGELDDGSIQGLSNPDKMQKRIREECEKIYPPIVWRTRIYEKDGKHGVRIEIEHSGDTPHFGGPAWIRRGSETIKANDETFQRLIDVRSGVVRTLTEWLHKDVYVEGDLGSLEFRERTLQGHARWPGTQRATLTFVNGYWATFKTEKGERSEPIEKLILSWGDREKALKVLVKL